MEDSYGACGGSRDEQLNSVISSVEQGLLQQFQCLATDDKDTLIAEFQRFLHPNQLSPQGCAFFLEMSNWNLQKAICAYFDFDFDSPKDYVFNPPSMTFVKDATVGEGEEVPPNTKFTKTWKIQNSGNEPWPVGCVLNFLGGDQMTACKSVFVDSLKPGEMSEVSLEMISPPTPGMYQGQWRMSTINGQHFGVAEGGLLGLTQQMNQFDSLGSPVGTVDEQMNPFELHRLMHQHQQESNLNNQETNLTFQQTLLTSTQQINNLIASTGEDYGMSNGLEQQQQQQQSAFNEHFQSLHVNNENNIAEQQRQSTKVSSIDSDETHLPPTPPLSEDMIL